MFNIGTAEVLVIALLALVVLGPDKLPQAARQVGKFTSQARQIANGFRQEMHSAMKEVGDTATPTDASGTGVNGNGHNNGNSNGNGNGKGDGAAGRRLDAPPTGAEPIDTPTTAADPNEP